MLKINSPLLIHNLTKSFDSQLVLKNMSFSLNKKEFVCLTGANGAGKSTTFKCILGMLNYEEESKILINGYDIKMQPKKAKSYVGFAPDNGFFYPYLSGLEHIKLWSHFRSIKNYDTAIDLSNFIHLSKSDLSKRVNTYSRGMKQKLSFIGAIFHNPLLIILDEPFTAMDLDSTNRAIELLYKLKQDGSSLLFSTHQLEIQYQLADKVVNIKDGMLVEA